MRGRFAPSPTGAMHLGNAWAALLAWLQVRAGGGTMVLRVEDLDSDRSRRSYTEALLEDLKWLGLNWDEGPDGGGDYGPYCQNERRDLYAQALEKLQQQELLYTCQCTRAQMAACAPHNEDGERVYPGTCRNKPHCSGDTGRGSLRLKVSPGQISFMDGVLGHLEQDVKQSVGDFVLRRADGIHAYQLAVVVDDALMNISHVLRGNDLAASTPRQLLLYQLLELTPPAFSHVPLLLGEDGHRLSKRHGSLSIAALRQQGVQPQSIIGYLAWKAGLLEKQQPAAAQELIGSFALSCLPADPVIVKNGLSELL